MKKITLLITLMITSLGFSQPTGTWKLTQEAGAFAVGPTQGSGAWYTSSPGEVSTRACLFDDEYVFNADGSFQNVLQTETWLEVFQGKNPEACGTPVAPHDGSVAATWAYSAANNTIILTGKGAFLGLAKVNNGLTLTSPANAPVSITYTVTALTGTNMTIDIMYDNGGSPAWWRFKFTKKLAGQPVIGALSIPSTITVGDAPFELVDPTSDSPGAFTYTSSNTAVATISGATVFVVGSGTTTITATQAASGAFVSGSVNADLYVYATPPTTSAPIPPARNAGDVISIFSGAYTNLGGTAICQCWGQSTVVDELDPGNGDVFKRMVKFTYQGVVPTASMNVSGGYKLHIDIYKTDMTSMDLYLIQAPSGETSQKLTPTAVGWNSFDIDVNATNFPGLDLTNIFQMKLVSDPADTTTYFDNLYFYKTALGVSKFDASGIKMYPNPVKNSLTIEANSAIQKVSVYNVLGQEVMSRSPKSNSTTLQTNELQKGVYMVKTEIDGNVSSSKIIKE